MHCFTIGQRYQSMEKRPAEGNGTSQERDRRSGWYKKRAGTCDAWNEETRGDYFEVEVNLLNIFISSRGVAARLVWNLVMNKTQKIFTIIWTIWFDIYRLILLHDIINTAIPYHHFPLIAIYLNITYISLISQRNHNDIEHRWEWCLVW